MHNYLRRGFYTVTSTDAVPAGRHELRFEFEPTGKPDLSAGKGAPGRARLYVDRQLVAEADLPVTTPVMFNPGGLTCGANPGQPVTPRLSGTVPFQRHDPHRDRRPVRRTHRRRGQRDAHAHGPAV
ncbi:hypothetical protein ACFY8C_38720 [Streptomyces flavochromogenes]|uniref:Uncharacterized protein n=1 Tax=Streptomyces flavochromogenes TaxID=68199 RepID=A0ABW6Y372_9ACTN|nr:hypothetical protein [Streptomyces flavochromogenes]